MAYKYQSLFDELQLENCPSDNLEEIEELAYRWAHDPITDKLNFLPNVLYDKERNRPPRVLDIKDLCPLCNLSFYDNEANATESLTFFKKRLEKKHIDLLHPFYSHIAMGRVEKKDGVATKKDKYGHYGFYEYENCEFKTKFQILKQV